MYINNSFMVLLKFSRIFLSIKQGEALKKYVNLGIEKQCRNKNNASWLSISCSLDVISFKFSNFGSKIEFTASGKIGAPNNDKVCFSVILIPGQISLKLFITFVAFKLLESFAESTKKISHLVGFSCKPWVFAAIMIFERS